MKLIELLATEFLAAHREEVKSNYYTNLYDILNSIIETYPQRNQNIANQLKYIADNTTSSLLLSLPMAEELYFKYKDKRGDFPIDYSTRTGINKNASILQLKAELTKAKTAMFHLFALIGKNYNYDIAKTDGGGGV